MCKCAPNQTFYPENLTVSRLQQASWSEGQQMGEAQEKGPCRNHHQLLLHLSAAELLGGCAASSKCFTETLCYPSLCHLAAAQEQNVWVFFPLQHMKYLNMSAHLHGQRAVCVLTVLSQAQMGLGRTSRCFPVHPAWGHLAS